MKQSEHIIKQIRPRIIRSFASSETRKKVICYLAKYPEGGTYLEEIVKETGISHSNALGAIFGDGKDYSRGSSLINLGLVDIIKDGKYRYYKISELGIRSINIVKESD
jgi:predicted transcriptional regulator with HTH domain